MKRFLMLLLSFYRSWVVASENAECKHTDLKGIWHCSWEDNALLLTYDCLVNREKTFELQLWSTNFPEETQSLKVQNCETLLLDSNCTSETKPPKDFQYLHVLNISELYVIGRENVLTLPEPKKQTKSSRRGWSSKLQGYADIYNMRILEMHKYMNADHLPKYVSPGESEKPSTVRLPANVIFENIAMATFQTPLISEFLEPCGIRRDEYSLETFKLINVTMDQLNSLFLWEDPENSARMKEFVMDKVTVREVQPKSIYLHNENATLEITNSNFSSLNGRFLDFDVAKVTITQSSFSILTQNSVGNVADKFIFSKNEVASLGGYSFTIQSQEIEISNNIFHHIDDYAFLNVMASTVLPNLNSNPIRRTLNISDNIIHALAPAAIEVGFAETDEKSYFDVIAVANNLITCSCANIFWFHSMRTQKYGISARFFHYLLFRQKNQNRCSNIRNCYINQVLYNYHELCFDNYKCSDIAMNDTFYEKPTPDKSKDQPSDDGNLKMFDILTSQNERVKGIFEDLKNLLSEERKLIIYENEKGINSYLKSIFSCLLVMTFLFCSVLTYAVGIKYVKFSFFRALWMRYRFKNPYSETELNSSRTSLTA